MLICSSASSSQHGDLTASHQAGLGDTERLHAVRLRHSSNGNNDMELGERLELGVGGSGVIGRTLSVMRGGEEVGNGVIGWN